jgi:hypothetical protein
MAQENVRWKFKQSGEYVLLEQYWRKYGGLIFDQVHVFGRKFDGVRILNTKFKHEMVSHSLCSIGEFENIISDNRNVAVEVIEVKKGGCGRYVFGQALAGAELLKMMYGDMEGFNPSLVDGLIICTTGDQYMERICEKYGVKVWTPDGWLVPSDGSTTVRRKR